MKTFAMIFVAASLAGAGAAQGPAEWTGEADRMFAQGRYEAAEPLYRKTLEAEETARAVAIARANLGTVLRLRGQFEAAEPLLLQAVSTLRTGGAGDAVSLCRTLQSLALVYQARHDLMRAEEAAEEAADRIREVPSASAADRHQAELALAAIYVDARRFTDAERLLESAAKGGTRKQAAAAAGTLTAVATQMGNSAQAEQYGREAVERARAAFPAGHPAIAAALNNLAQSCRFAGKYQEAEAHYREAIDIWRAALGEKHPDLARGFVNLAALYHDRGREAGAEELYLKAACIFESVFGAQHPQTLTAKNELADVLRMQRRFSEADRLGRLTLAALERVLPNDDPRLTRALQNRARLVAEMKHERGTTMAKGESR